MKTSRFCSALLLCLLLCTAAFAQWSADPAANLPIADKGSGNDQVQPKLVQAPNNSWWLSWFDNDPTAPPPHGYDVRVQRLTAAGMEVMPHDGNLVAKLSNSSTEDYGLDVDTSGNALIAFLDTREGSNQQVTANRINPS